MFDFVFLWVLFLHVFECVYVCFLLFFCFCFSYSGFLIAYLFSKEREKKNMELSRYRSGEDLGGVEGGKTMIRIYCMKKFSINKCITD